MCFPSCRAHTLLALTPFLQPRGQLAVLLPAILLAVALLPTVSLAQNTLAQDTVVQNSVRLGLVHFYPRFCAGQEQGRKDQWVLQLAFGLGAPQRGKAGLPWFYRQEAAAAGQVWLVLDSMALWGKPLHALVDHHGDFALRFTAEGDRLARWKKKTVQRIPYLQQTLLPSLAPFQWNPPPPSPFWHGRFAGSTVLPYFHDFDKKPASPGTGRGRGMRHEKFCMSWPLQVRHTSLPEQGGYRLEDPQALQGRPPFQLNAYATLPALLRAIHQKKVDGALLAGEEFKAVLKSPQVLPTARTGQAAGTQHILLRIHPTLRKKLGWKGLETLSLATPRKRLAATAGMNYRPARAFLVPPFPPFSPAPLLRWNARRARQRWLRREHPIKTVTLATLAHPVLERVASALAGQWEKTLGLELTIEVLPVKNFLLPSGAPSADVVLTVADYNDGSLQDLWEQALISQPGAHIPDSSLSAIETYFRQTLPYLPLLHDAYFLLAPSPEAYQKAATLCPGCIPISPNTFPASVLLAEPEEE